MLNQVSMTLQRQYHPFPGEQSAIEECRSGNLEAFNTIVLTYQDLLFRVALRLLTSEAAAMDVVQETFISAFSKIYQFHGDSLRSWLIRIAVNKSYDVIRSRQYRMSVPLESLREDLSEEKFQYYIKSNDSSPEEIVDRHDLQAIIHSCLEKLPFHLRSTILLVDAEELSYAEAADVLQIPIGTVKSRLARARLKMQELLRSAGVNA